MNIKLRYILLCFGLFFSMMMSAQSLKCQYWFDKDYDNIVETTTSMTTFDQTLDVSALREGVHHFFFRVRNNLGVWSPTLSHQFMKLSVGEQQQSQLAAYQYWFDGDITNAVTTDLEAGTSTVDAALDLSALRVGTHTVSIRSKDNFDRWSEVLTYMFVKVDLGDFVDTEIAAYQYWFDKDDAHAVKVDVEEGTTIISPSVDASGLADGAHTVCFRTVDTKGRWSSTMSHVFIKLTADAFADSHINCYQYWFNKNDAEAVTMSVAEGTSAVNQMIDIPGIPDGVHTLKFRTKDSEGRWSSILSHTFIKIDQAVYNAAKIASYQYWFDNDFTTAVTASLDPQVKDLEMYEFINVDDIPVGDHSLSIRFCDTEGRWSPIISNDVTVGVVGETVDLAYGENLVNNGETLSLEGWTQKKVTVDGVSYTKMVADALMNNYTTGYEGDHTTDFDSQRVVFHGASNSNGYVYQDIRLENFVPQTGNLTVDLYGTLSYYKTQGDYAGIEFGFYDENGILIGSTVHYTNKDHVWPETTDYILHDKTTSFVVPANTDYVRVSCYSVIKDSRNDNDGCILQVGLKATSNVVTINYSTGANGSTIDPTSANYGEATVSSVIPFKPGSIFRGWSITEGGSADFAPGELFVHKDGIAYDQGKTTLYAVWEEELSYTRATTVGRYGTLCLPKASASVEGATVYTIAGKRVDGTGNVTSVVLEEVSSLEAGKPYVFCATASELKVVYAGDATAEAGNDNGLHGTFVYIDVEEGMYLISNNEIVKCGTGCSVGANRAYIDMQEVAEYTEGTVSPAKIAVIGLDGTTGIDGLTVEGDAVRYNLSGIRVSSGTKGIVIINGKKIIKK